MRKNCYEIPSAFPILRKAFFRSQLAPDGERAVMGSCFRPAQTRGQHPDDSAPVAPRELSPAAVDIAARRIRAAAAEPVAPADIAAILARAIGLWRDRGFSRRRRVILGAAAASGFSAAGLEESLDALMAPFDASALASFARRVTPHARLFGFIMPGNVIGGGLHEICQALIAGAGAIVKTASAEPRFYPAFARTLKEIDARAASRIAVLGWGREQAELTEALLQSCDYIVAFGGDDTISHLASAGGANLIGFGSRVSGALLSREAVAGSQMAAQALAIARDVSLFEQRGCLSPHHVFVEDPQLTLAPAFASELARALDAIARLISPPDRFALQDAAAIRRAREIARWRRLGGAAVEMHEGERFAWTVIYDRQANFTVSPGYRTAYVTPIADLADLETRLAPVAGRLEGFALGDPAGRLEPARRVLRALGVSWIAPPGRLQSPPLEWRHGGGAMLDLLCSRS